MSRLAPIILFTYNRLTETQRTIEALSGNYLASESELFVYSDQGKNDLDKGKVEQVRQYLKTIKGFKEVTINEAIENKGLANSVISGVTEVLENYESVIVVEDDLVTSKNFLDFMNQALDFYAQEEEVISISGYTLNLPTLSEIDKDYYVGFRASSWGWGMWANKWRAIDWEVKDYEEFLKDSDQRRKFALIASDLPGMLKHQMTGKIDSWAIRLSYHQFRNQMISIFPKVSKLVSIGSDKNATHTVGVTKFDTKLDLGGQRTFDFDKRPQKNDKILSDFKAVFSVRQRLWDKLLRLKESMKR